MQAATLRRAARRAHGRGPEACARSGRGSGRGHRRQGFAPVTSTSTRARTPMSAIRGSAATRSPAAWSAMGQGRRAPRRARASSSIPFIGCGTLLSLPRRQAELLRQPDHHRRPPGGRLCRLCHRPGAEPERRARWPGRFRRGLRRTRGHRRAGLSSRHGDGRRIQCWCSAPVRSGSPSWRWRAPSARPSMPPTCRQNGWRPQPSLAQSRWTAARGCWTACWT